MVEWRAPRDAFRPRLEHPEDGVVWAILLGLLAIGAYSFLVGTPSAPPPVVGSMVVLGVVTRVAFMFVDAADRRLLLRGEIVLLAAILAHAAGLFFGFYPHVPHFDSVLHFAAPAFGVYALYALGVATRTRWMWSGGSRTEEGVHAFTFLVTVGAVWEVVELATDALLGSNAIKAAPDTAMDLTMDVLGALVGTLVVVLVVAPRSRRRAKD